MNSQNEIKETIESNHLSSSFLERIAEQLGSHIGAKIIYGEPVEHDGVTIIPVAKVSYGFGGGSGHKKNGEEGSGGGGGAKAHPVGYIELKNGDSAFRPIRSTASVPTAFLLGTLSGALLSFMFGRIFGRRSGESL